MKIAILDNDKDFCDKIKQLIIDNSYVSGFDIDMYESPHIFLENRNKYDVLFLEIDLLEIDGIDIVRKLKSNQIIIVVVTNSYDRITEVIGINVAGYIIKNQIDIEFKKIIKEILEYVDINKNIMITTKNDIYCYKPAEILLIEYIDRHLYVYKKNGYDDLGYISIKDVIKTLPIQFVLVNKNQIINIDKIAFMVGMNIKLKYSDMIVEVSRRKRREVFELMIRAINRI